ncbi:MAG: enoyl-CoA hydratase, partial [Acidimicrobiia bacterium]
LNLAARICAVGPIAARASLRALERVLTESDELGWTATGDALDAISGTEDMAEGMRAFFERRVPQWTGR